MAQPITGGDFASTFYQFGAAPGAAIAKNRDYYAQLADDAAQAKYREGALANEQARIAESRRQFEITQSMPGTIQLQGDDGQTYVYPTHQGQPDLAHPYGKAPLAGGSWNSPEVVKDYFAADAELNNLKGMKDQLKAAYDLNDKTFTGFMAGAPSAGIQLVPDSWKESLKEAVPGSGKYIDPISDAATATEQINTLTAAAAIFLNSPLLKGSPSEFEAKTVLGLLQSKDPKVRGDAIMRAQALIDTFIASASARKQAFSRPGATTPPPPDGGATTPPPPAGGATTSPATGANRLTPARAAELQATIARINAEPDLAKQKAYLDEIRAALIAQSINPAQYGL